MKSTMTKTILLFSAFALSGFAEAITIKVPFEFSAAVKTFPAGEYCFQEETAGVLVISGSTPGSSMLTLTRSSRDIAPAKAGLTFSATRALSTISMPDGKKVELLNSK
jgi:hypothetical protein